LSFIKRVCRNGKCALIDKPCTDPERRECSKCGKRLHVKNVVRLARNENTIRGCVDGVFRKAMKWSLKAKERVFEGLAYSPLSSLKDPKNQETIAVLQRDQLADSLRFRY
jgi:hypothetical protein